MKKIYIFFLAFILLFLPLSTFAQSNFKSDKVVTLAKDEVVDKDYFAAGNSVILSGTVNGDAYLAGSNITVDGTVNGDLLAAGGNLDIRGKVNGNIRLMGGQITLSGEVLKNTTVAGGQINILNNTRLGGSLVTAGGNITISSTVPKELTAAGGQINLNSSLEGDLTAATSDLVLGPQAKVAGNVNYWSDNKAMIDPSATVSGKVTQNIPPRNVDSQQVNKNLRNTLAGVFGFLKIVNLISAIIIGLILIKLFPVFSKDTADLITARPWASLGVGLVFAIVTPIVAVILAVSLIGLPLALITFAAYLILIYISKIYISIMIGQKIVSLFNQTVSIYWVFVLGILIYSLLTLIPVLGWLIIMVLGFMGLGALVMQKKNYYQMLSSKRQI